MTPLGARDAAAWLLRAIILVQPFPDGNHRTGVAAAELILRRAGLAFRPTVESARAFHRAVTSARYRLLIGYDDAPLTVLQNPEDEVMETCRRFVHASLTERA